MIKNRLIKNMLRRNRMIAVMQQKIIMPVFMYDWNDGACSGIVVFMFEQDKCYIKYKIMYIDDHYDNNFTCDSI